MQLVIVHPGDARCVSARHSREQPIRRPSPPLWRTARRHPAVYNREQAGVLRDQLLGPTELVWVNPIEAGTARR
jgi:hypothetical protein